MLGYGQLRKLKIKGLWVRNETTEAQLSKGVGPGENNAWSPGRGFLERRSQFMRMLENGGF